MIAVRITNMRRGPFGAVLAFFSVVIGDENEEGEFTGGFRLESFGLFSKTDDDGET